MLSSLTPRTYLQKNKKKLEDGLISQQMEDGNGLRVTKQFIQGLKKHLLNTGRAYFIFSSLSNRSTLEHYLKNERLFSWIVARRKFDGEELDVYCVTPTD